MEAVKLEVHQNHNMVCPIEVNKHSTGTLNFACNHLFNYYDTASSNEAYLNVESLTVVTQCLPSAEGRLVGWRGVTFLSMLSVFLIYNFLQECLSIWNNNIYNTTKGSSSDRFLAISDNNMGCIMYIYCNYSTVYHLQNATKVFNNDAYNYLNSLYQLGAEKWSLFWNIFSY